MRRIFLQDQVAFRFINNDLIMTRDIHKKRFDDGTIAKLDLFKFYIREWLPVFIAARNIYWKTINIYDFFAGPGKDITGTEGTPLIILKELEPYIPFIKDKGLTVNLYFNEYDRGKCEELKINVLKYAKGKPYNIEIESKDFADAFPHKYDSLIGNDKTNLLFLDQTGIKQINPERFKMILAIKRTDFLFFISSSTIKRFSEHPAIAKHIKIDKERIKNVQYHRIHLLVLEFYKSLIPRNKKYYLAPFSIKKKSGVYGLIFGSHDVLGAEKFLNAAWKIDKERGTANFDIDNDNIVPGQMNLFTGEVNKPKKIEVFEKKLSERILQKNITTDKEVYLFLIESGVKPSHGRDVLRKLIKNKKLKSDTFDLSNKVCKPHAKVTQLKIQ